MSPSRPATGIALLVVEEGATRSVARAMLVAAGHEVRLAADAIAFAEAFAEARFTVAVVSTRLGWSDGFEAARAIRARLPQVAVCLLGDPTGPGAALAARSVGADLVAPTVEGLATLVDRAVRAPPTSQPADAVEPLRAQCAALEAEVAALRAAPESQRFAAEIAHDLREPMRTFQLLLESLQGRLAAGEVPAASSVVARLYDAATRMETLLDGALAGVRGEDGPSSSHADRVLDEVVDLLRATLAETGGSITRDALPELGLPPHQLRQILQNLVANALRYGGERPAVHVSALREPDGWVLSVQDSGPGIPAGRRDEVFKPGIRLAPGTLPSGHGLGLAICRKVVERAGGKIWVEDAPTGGSVFRVALPAPPRDGTVRASGK